MEEGKIKTFRQFTLEGLTPQHNTQMGSNPGGIHTDSTGSRYYVKFYKNADQAKTEALAGNIYHQMGIHTVKPEYRQVGGKHAVVSRYNEHLTKLKPHEFEHVTPEQAKQIGRMYHGAVLTKNWDIVGLEHDNILKDLKTGNLHSVDGGGSFHFRAQGEHKTFGPDVDEHHSLRHKNEQASHVFNRAFENHPHAEHEGLDSVKRLNDDSLHHAFKNSGLSNWEDLHKNFMLRKKALLSKY